MERGQGDGGGPDSKVVEFDPVDDGGRGRELDVGELALDKLVGGGASRTGPSPPSG